jgi:hypothetical protein
VSGFTQQNPPMRIIELVPTEERYWEFHQIQVGAFKIFQNAELTFNLLKAQGLNPFYEPFEDFTRVLVTGIKSDDLPLIAETLEKAGFSEIIIRPDLSTGFPPPPAGPESTEAEEIELSTYSTLMPDINAPVNAEMLKGKTALLCKTWKLNTYNGAETAERTLTFLEDGIYSVVDQQGNVWNAQWRWNNEAGLELAYSHDNWQYYGIVTLKTLTDTLLAYEDLSYFKNRAIRVEYVAVPDNE